MMRNSGCEVPEYMLKIKKPWKNELRKMAQQVPKRHRISTEPLQDEKKRCRLARVIRQSKANKEAKEAKGPSTKADTAQHTKTAKKRKVEKS